jgi:cytochrome c biogenesis protein CcmG/thiol:disulfide interchange protein DsbE
MVTADDSLPDQRDLARDERDVDGFDEWGEYDDEEPGNPRGPSIRVTAGVVGVVVLVFIALLATRQPAENDPSFDIVGEPSPPVSGVSYDGATFDLDAVLTANRELPPEEQTWVVVNFFASWCAPCEAEHPDLIRFDTEGIVRPDGTACSTELVGITVRDDADDVTEFFDRLGGDWPVLVGETNSSVVDFGVTAPPETVIIAPNGLVVQKVVGQTSYEQLTEVIPC